MSSGGDLRAVCAFFVFMIGHTGGSEDVAAIINVIIAFCLPWIYYAAMESSGKQATLGKMALGIKVTSS